MIKKRILSPLICILVVISLCTGCHGSKRKDAFVMPESFDASREYNITFWAKNDTNKSQVEVYENAISDFEEIYPNIHVTLRLYTDYNRIYNDVITNIPTDTTPNVCITYPDHIATYMTGNETIVKLDTLFSDSRYGLGGSEVHFESPAKDKFVSKFLNECIINGSYYALPFMRSTEVCYINKTYVEKLGYEVPDILTWDYIWEVSDAATKKNADGSFVVNNQMVLIPFIYKSTDNMMISMLKQQDAGYSDSNGNILIFNDSTKQIMKDIAEHTKNGAFSTFKISGYPANFLNAGQCIFAIDSTAGSTWMGSEAPLLDIPEDQLVNFETVVRPIPQYNPENPKMISQGPSICVFNKRDPQEVLASWLFAQFLTTNDVQIGYAKTEGYVPVTMKAQESEEYVSYLSKSGIDNDLHYRIKLDACELFNNNIDNTFVTPVFNGSTSLRSAAGQLIENTTKSVRRNQVVNDSFIEQQFKDVKSLYRLDQVGKLSSDKKFEFGKLPTMSILLLSLLGFTWVLIILYFVINKLRKKKKQPSGS